MTFLSIFVFMNIWIIFSWRPLQTKLLWALLHKFFCQYVSFLLAKYLKVKFLSRMKDMFDFFFYGKKLPNFYLKFCITFSLYQWCMTYLFVPHSQQKLVLIFLIYLFLLVENSIIIFVIALPWGLIKLRHLLSAYSLSYFVFKDFLTVECLFKIFHICFIGLFVLF